MDFTEKQKKEQLIYKGKILDLYNDIVELPDGKEAYREIIRHSGAVAVVAFDENDNLLLVEQYRYALGKNLLEIPAGKLEKGEDPYDAAIRELEEETGYKANSLVSLGTLVTAVGYSDEIIHIYLAKDLVKTQVNPDEGEFLNIISLPLGKINQMMVNNEITDAKTLAALMKYKLSER